MKSMVFLTLYLLALINPVSKIFLIAGFRKKAGLKETGEVIIKSSLAALVILLAFALGGNFVLTKIFHIQIYAFKIAAGIILFPMGINALWKGIFYETDTRTKFADLSIVPIASPLIAGPATITAVISFSAEYGLPQVCLAATVAIAVNLLLMLSSELLHKALIRYNILGALIKITGLIVATIAVQMVLDGAATWLKLSLNT